MPAFFVKLHQESIFRADSDRLTILFGNVKNGPQIHSFNVETFTHFLEIKYFSDRAGVAHHTEIINHRFGVNPASL